jgi:hypothetical protein
MNPTFSGHVADGKVKIRDRPLFLKYLASLEGKAVQITVGREVRRRTLPQNAYLWGVVYKLISETTGHTPDELHAAFKYMYSPKAVVGSLVVPKSTRTHDTLEMTEYIERIRQWAVETLGMNIPDPEQGVEL